MVIRAYKRRRWAWCCAQMMSEFFEGVGGIAGAVPYMIKRRSKEEGKRMSGMEREIAVEDGFRKC